MPSSLLELTASIVSSHASTVGMTSDELLLEIQKVHAALKQLEEGTGSVEQPTAPPVEQAAVPAKKSIQKNQIICLECGKGGFKTLSRHLKQTHGMTAGEYRSKHGFSAKTVLAAKAYSEARRESAIKNNLGEKLAEGREKYQAEQAASKASVKKASAGSKPADNKKPVARKPRKKSESGS